MALSRWGCWISGECVPQVILVDVQMQGLSGVELIEELRARSKASHLCHQRELSRRTK